MTYEPPIRDRLHSYGGNTFISHDCQIAAIRLDEAVTLCDRAQDYLSIKLAHDPLAAGLAAEMRDFIGLVDHVCAPDDETPNVEVRGWPTTTHGGSPECTNR